MNRRKKPMQVVASLIMALLLCLTIMPVSAMATVDESAMEQSADTSTPPAGSEDGLVPPAESLSETGSSSQADAAAAANPATATPAAADPALPNGGSPTTPPATYTVEYKVDGALAAKTEGLAADTAIPAPPDEYAAYIWAYTDDAGSPQSFVWGVPGQPAGIGQRSWELNGSAPQTPNNAPPQNDGPAPTRIITFTAAVEGQGDVSAFVEISPVDGVYAIGAADLEAGRLALNALLEPYDLQVSGWDGAYVGALVEEGGITVTASLEALNRGGADGDEHTVRFYSEDAEFARQTVADGQTATPPATNPDMPAGMTIFLGWFLDKDGSTPFDFAQPVTGDVSLYAVFTNKVLVTFKNADGEVYLTEEVEYGACATMPGVNPEPPSDDVSFQYWYIENDDSKAVFDFITTPVYSNITLVPRFGDSFYVFFDTNGGGAIDFQLVTHGQTAEEPDDPARAGYTFAFWSQNPDAAYDQPDKEAYSFADPVMHTFTLYAIWQPEKVGYTISYWVERANFSGDPGFDKGNYLYTTKVDVSAAQSSFYAGQLLDEATVISLADKGHASLSSLYTTAEGSRKYTWAALKYSEYNFSDASIAAITLDGGSNIINVYYSRDVFTVTVKLDTNKTVLNPSLVMNGRTYTTGANAYTFEGKYEQDVSGVFPPDSVVKSDSGHVIDGWEAIGNITNRKETPHSSIGVYPEYFVPGNVDQGGRTFTLLAVWMDAGRYMWRHNYISLTAEELETYKSTGVAAAVLTQSYFPENGGKPPTYLSYNGRVYMYVPIYTMEGYAKTGTTIESYNGGNMTGATRIRGGNRGVDRGTLFTDNQGSPTGSKGDQAILWNLFDRDSYTLTLNLHGGEISGQREWAGVQFGDLAAPYILKSYGTDIEYDETGMPIPTNLNPVLKFAGWYTDSGYEIKFEPARATMPSNNWVLHAKWNEGTYTATFYSRAGGGVVDRLSVDGGRPATPSHCYQAGQIVAGYGQFKGWGAFLPGTTVLQPYNFSAPVNSDIALYGIWKTDHFTVTYDIGSGSGQTPADTQKYKANVLAPVAAGTGFTAPNGQKFIGWRLNGAGAVYYPGSTIRVNGDLNLSALYVPENAAMVTLTYHANDGSGGFVQKQVLKGYQTVPEGSTLFVREGYELIGWSKTAGDANPVDYAFDTAFSVTDNMDLYAVWEKELRYTVTFKVADGQQDRGYLNEAGRSSVVFDNIKGGTLFDTVVSSFPQAIAGDGYYFTGWTPAGKPPMYVQQNLEFVAAFAAKTELNLADITVADKEKLYGASDPVLTFNWPAGIPQSHFTLALTRAEGENVAPGGYAINADVAVRPEFAERYTITGATAPGTLTVKPLPLNLAAVNSGKVYGAGDPTPLTTVSEAYGALLNPKAGFTKAQPVYTLSRESGENVGSYAITVNADAAANPNYDITTTPAVFTISEAGAPLVVNMGSFSKIYGNADPTAEEVAATLNVSNLVDGDTADMLGLAVTRAPGESVGTYSYIVTYDETFANNYTGITVNAGALEIRKRLVVLYAANQPAEGVLYPTDALPAFTAFIDPNTPLAFGETRLEYSLYLTDYSEPGTPPAGTYAIGFNVDPAAALNRNYDIYVVNGTLTISAAPSAPGETTDPAVPADPATPAAPGGAAPAPAALPAEPAFTANAPAPTAAEPAEAPENAQLVNLDGGELPFAAPSVRHWALVNLLIAVLSLVLGTLMFILLFRKNKKRRESDEERQARMMDEAAFGKQPQETVRNKKSGLMWSVLSVLAGILAPIVFLLTENINNPMVMVDYWTLLMVTILTVQLISMLLVRYVRSRRHTPEDEAASV